MLMSTHGQAPCSIGGVEESKTSLCPQGAQSLGQERALSTNNWNPWWQALYYTKGTYHVSEDEVTIYYFQGLWKDVGSMNTSKGWEGHSKQKEHPGQNKQTNKQTLTREHTVLKGWPVGLCEGRRGCVHRSVPSVLSRAGHMPASAPLCWMRWARKGRVRPDHEGL